MKVLAKKWKCIDKLSAANEHWKRFWEKLLHEKAVYCKSWMIKAMITGSLEKTVTGEICSTWISFPFNLNVILCILFYNE